MTQLKHFILSAWLFLALAAPGAARDPLWKFSLPSACVGSPAVSWNTSVVATRGGDLIALDHDGHMVWKQKLPAGCVAAPALAANGDLYVACADGSLLCFTASGMEIWRVALGQESMSTPLLGSDSLYAVGGSGRVFKVRKKDGAVLKQAELGLPVHASPVWDAGKNFLLVPAKDYVLFALDPELRVRWKFRTTGVIFSAPAITPGNEVYLTSMDHHLYKLDSGGRPLWKYKASGWIKASPVVDDRGRVYFGSYDRHVHAVSTNGKPQWRFQGKAQFTASAAIDAGGSLYCGDTSGTVYALGRDGRLAWEFKNPDFITSDLTILPGKVLLAGSIDGTLLAFRIERPLSRKAWWAKYLGNLANSGFDEN